jgi:hypothetical protein
VTDRGVAAIVGGALVLGVWLSLVSVVFARPPGPPGRPGRALLAAAVLAPFVAVSIAVGVGLMQLASCDYEGFFQRSVDCGATFEPLAGLWIALNACTYAVMVRSSYLDPRYRRRR